MSTTTTNQASNSVILTDIVAPNLDSAEYASSLGDVFTNINNNFGVLANREFVKGDGGKSVEVREVKFFNEDGSETSFGRKLKDCILGLSENQGEYADITIGDRTFTIWDRFTPENAEKLWMVYNYDSDINSVPVATTSLYYVFLDGRYANDAIGFADNDCYTNIKDFSCILVYANGEFTALTNAFPTIYYEKGIGLCWKINGTGSGIPVQGLPGRDGSNASLCIVKTDQITESTTPGTSTEVEVNGVYESYSGYIEVINYSEEELLDFDGQAALILASNGDSANKFYFGKLKLKEGVLYAQCEPSTSINSAITTEEILNAMKNIDLLNASSNASSGLRGLFIPIEKEIDGAQKVHLLTSASITNTDGIKDLKSDLLLTPVSDVNNLAISEINKLNVEKYLYVKLKTSHAIFSGNDVGSHSYLKYRLAKTVYRRDSDNFDVYNGINSGSRCYGSALFTNSLTGVTDLVDLTSENTACVGRDGTISVDHMSSMPASFYDRLSDATVDVPGIYKWELYSAAEEVDPNELLSENNVEIGNTYNFNNKFKAIYTTTLTPSTTSEFMWWDAMEFYDEYSSAKETINGNDKYVVPGWTTSTEDPIFSFVKFVPIYKNSYALDSDTALNLNYNVNITGDANHPEKSLTVHGAVNCDNLSVYKLTATGEIKDIYTKDPIVGEDGIYLANIDGEHKFVVDSEGKITAKSILANEDINSASVSTNTVNATEINSKDLDVQVFNENEDVTATAHIGVSGVCDKAVGVTVNNVHEIDIVACEHEASYLDSVSKVPVITTNVPAHMNGNSNIVISNQANDSKNVYFKNTLKDNLIDGIETQPLGVNPGKGVSENSNISETSFETAKNFNMHRLSMDAKSSSNTSTSSSTESKTVTSKESYSLEGNGTPSSASYTWTVDDKSSSMKREYNNTIPTVNMDYAKKNFIQAVEIKGNTGDYLSTKNNITINMNNYFWTLIGLYTGCSYSKRGQLHSDSYMKLGVYFTVSGDSTIYNTYVTSTFKFNYTTTSTSKNSPYSWVGVQQDGSSFGSKDYDNKWRYRSYIFKPGSMTITPSSGNFSKIVEGYNNGKTVTFYVVPVIYLKGFSQGDKRKLAGGVRATCPRPLSIPTSQQSSIQTTKLDSGDTHSTGKYVYPIYKELAANDGSATYTISTTRTSSSTNVSVESDVKATTICNDGIVMRAGGYVFGLGYGEKVVDHKVNGYGEKVSGGSNPHWKVTNKDNYISNVPVLFYHKYNPNYYNLNYTAKDSTMDSQGYAERTNAIPLEDIFEAIRILRNDDFKKYGL